jgi:hypothetical protein
MRLNFKIVSILLLVWNVAAGQVPTIQSFSPTAGLIGTTVTITGTNFSSTASDNIVFFGSVRTNVISATPTTLTVTVPLAATYQPITVTVNGLTTASSNPFMVLFSGPHGINTSSFSLGVRTSTGGSSFATIICQGDFDVDGKLDLATMNWDSKNFSILRNTGNGPGNFSYQVTTFATPTPAPLRISIGDLDGDGKPEVVSHVDGIVSVYHNVSSGPGDVAFSKLDFPIDPSPGSTPAISDLDLDGRPDLVMTSGTSYTSGITRIFRNISSAPGNINFAPATTLPSPNHNRTTAAIGDFNGDGKPDLVTTGGADTDGMTVYQNMTTGPGDLNFVKIQDYTSGAISATATIADLDGDTKPDMLVPSQSGYFSAYLNTSSTSTVSFAEQVKIDIGANSYSISVGDLDGDGKIDVYAEVGWQFDVLRNISTPGNINFEPVVAFAGDWGPSVIGDQDGDGKSDIAIFTGSEVAVWSNNIPGSISGKLDQSITFTLTPKKFGEPDFLLTATASSNLPVFYSSSDENKAEISGSTVTIKAPGTVTITATQSGNETFDPAEAVSRELIISKGNQSIDFQTITTQTVGTISFDLAATASSGLPVEFASVSDKISVDGDKVSILKAGSVTIIAKQIGNDYYSAAAEITQTFCINPPKPIINTFSLTSGAAILTSSSSSGNQWYNDGVPINDAVSNIYITEEPGIYTVKVTVDNCSSEFSAEVPLVVTGILETTTTGLPVYPNPASSKLNIDLSAFSENGEIEVVIYDRSGRVVEQLVKRNGKANITVSSYPPGLYFVLATQRNKKFVSKFVKE